jgi:hypothetical protein
MPAPAAKDPITITFGIDLAGGENKCKAHTNYKGEDVTQFGATWTVAQENVVAKCKELKALGDPPADIEIDLDAA